MDRRTYLLASLGSVGAAAAGVADGSGGIKIVTDPEFARLVVAADTPEENWAPAIEAAWDAAAAAGTDVFLPAGVYPVRLRRVGGGWGPALDLAQPLKYRSVRMLGPAQGAEIRLTAWPEGADPRQEIVRVRSAHVSARGGLDVAVAISLANLRFVHAFTAPPPGWREPHDYFGVGVRLVGVMGGSVKNCFFQGMRCGLVLGDDRGPVSYQCLIEENRFQYCNEAVLVPSTANGHSIRNNAVLWLHQPTSGVTAAFTTQHSTTSVFFTENSAEQCACWVYRIGATTNARISGGRFESVYGAIAVPGTGRYGARGTQISGLSVDCDSLRGPAISIERANTTSISGVTFYQSETPNPHLRVGPAARETVGQTLASSGTELRIEDLSPDFVRLGGPR